MIESATSQRHTRRLGDVQKCPACGSEIDPGAYHCPKCRNYFCFRCRARVSKPDPQFQCTNLSCDYHGKLLCGACDPEVKKQEPPTVYNEHEGGWWPHLAFGGLLVAGIALFYSTVLVAAAIALGTAIIGFLLHRAGVNIVGKDKQITWPRVSVYHTCIRCGEAVKEVQ
jgi:hypothetical protein